MHVAKFESVFFCFGETIQGWRNFLNYWTDYNNYWTSTIFEKVVSMMSIKFGIPKIRYNNIKQ